MCNYIPSIQLLSPPDGITRQTRLIPQSFLSLDRFLIPSVWS